MKFSDKYHQKNVNITSNMSDQMEPLTGCIVECKHSLNFVSIKFNNELAQANDFDVIEKFAIAYFKNIFIDQSNN